MEGSGLLQDEGDMVPPKFTTEINTTTFTSVNCEDPRGNLTGINDNESKTKNAKESEKVLAQGQEDEGTFEKNYETKNQSISDDPVPSPDDESLSKLPPNGQRCVECDNGGSINDQNDVTLGVHRIQDIGHPNDNQVLVPVDNQNYCSTPAVCESCGKQIPILELYRTDAETGGRLSRGTLKRVSVSSSFRKNIAEEVDNGEVMDQQSLTFIDFVPEKQNDTKGETSNLSYENFRSLVKRANQWLQEKSHFCVVNCETVLFKLSAPEVDPNITIYADNPQYPLWGVRGLRLWICPAKKDSPQLPWNIHYVNLLPQKIGETDVGNQQRHFVPLSKVVDNFNHLAKSGNIEGNLIAAETIPLEITNIENVEEIDTDGCLWESTSSVNKEIVFMLRVYYRENSANTSCESLEKYGDSQQMSYLEQHNLEHHFARFLRVFYARQNSSEQKTTHLTRRLTCKTIVPAQYRSNMNNPPHDDAVKIKEMISSWVKLSGAVVINAATDIVQLSLYGEVLDKTEVNKVNVKPTKTCYYMYITRLYLDGQYEDPPSDQLLGSSSVKNSGCCVLL
ncbi:uncharacterized protein LOC111089360 isoform X2 [Limulus polyphemus]|uniref:Uncharacterized protein LOC111089360 isoform X2 n=1 Tax=Limulus polyphemus TaxID=6850 RepID=A0ABM1TNI1_LIMPO|nr:uncharacterized protein LOC111089360 isoform X2 [Limulus polyphemus]